MSQGERDGCLEQLEQTAHVGLLASQDMEVDISVWGEAVRVLSQEKRWTSLMHFTCGMVLRDTGRHLRNLGSWDDGSDGVVGFDMSYGGKVNKPCGGLDMGCKEGVGRLREGSHFLSPTTGVSNSRATH